MKCLLVTLVVALLAGSVIVAECGQVDYPKHGQPITIINPWAAGGEDPVPDRSQPADPEPGKETARDHTEACCRQ